MYVTVTKVTFLINALRESVICEGNSDEDYLKLPNIHKNVLMNHSSKLCTIFICMQMLTCDALLQKLRP